MRRVSLGVLCALLLVWGCDEPDEIYQELPDNFNPTVVNGNAPVSQYYRGEKGFDDPTLAYGTSLPTVEVCSDSEIAERWAWMVNQPIIPMQGAGGLDMTGGEDFAGLTIDEAQSADMLCQAIYYADGIAAWGDQFELIAFWDEQTREIFDILLWPGYKGVIEAGEFVFEVNEPITRDGVPLSRGDGSDRDPKTDENMREMDRALIRAFRPQLNADEIDCVDAGSCYIIDSGSVPTLVFMSVGMYVPLEPVQQHIVQLEVSLKRPFRIGMGSAEVVGITPTISGTAAAGIGDCEVTFGTTWDHIEANCLADDSMAMAEVTAVYGYELLLVSMGGVLLYMERPDLAIDEILPIEPTLNASDNVTIMSINAAYEGEFSMPYSEVLEIFKANLDAAIRDEVPSLLPEDLTGVELLRTPNDPNLPTDVAARYPDRLRPGGIYAVFCEDDGPDIDDTYDSCLTDATGRPLMPLTYTLQSLVSSALGADVTTRLTEPSLYVQHFERALGQYFNGGVLLDDQINFSASSGSPDRIYATVTIPDAGTSYTFNLYYGGNDDRIHFMNFQQGATRMEDVLLADAGMPTPSDPSPSGVFTLNHLLDSPRMGLGATGTISIQESHPETRRALIGVMVGSSSTLEVLAPYQEASSVTGYWIPTEGPQSIFQPADWFALYGNTISADFFLAPADGDTGELEVVAITGNDFFGDIAFCGFQARIGDFADDLLESIQDANYPCEMIVRRSENREFITSLNDMDQQVRLLVTNNMINQVFVWAR